MKTLNYLILILLFAGCVENPPESYSDYKPILMKRSDLEQSIKMEGAKPISHAGKIYRYGNFLFINEMYEGIHVIDNSDPGNPINSAFINIPGNVDIAIANDIIYADNSVDLVSLKVDNEQVVVTDRDREVFPEMIAPDGGFIPTEFNKENRPANTVIIKWVKK